ncbi:MAG: FecR domain-containing protein [Cyanobacteria bacterium P01_A01_bin.105]
MSQSLFPPRLVVRRLTCLLGLISLMLFQSPANAQVALTWARVQLLRNRVQLIPSGRGARPAEVANLMGIGDALRTAASSRAELRFNDGSLARIGERATFRFTPNTRNFQLSNGTVLLLVPPGRGRSTLQTPNTVTGIQGSALFVRYSPATHTTVIGALTDNPAGPMVAYNQDGSQQQPLASGQLVVITGNTITPPIQFDLRTFYETSGLVEGLQLPEPDAEDGPPELAPGTNRDAGIDAVRQEIRAAIAQQAPLSNQATVTAPVFEPPAISAPAISSTAISSTDISSTDISSTDISAPASAADPFTNSYAQFRRSPAAQFLGLPLENVAQTTPTSPVPTQAELAATMEPTPLFESSVNLEINPGTTADTAVATEVLPSDTPVVPPETESTTPPVEPTPSTTVEEPLPRQDDPTPDQEGRLMEGGDVVTEQKVPLTEPGETPSSASGTLPSGETAPDPGNP